MCKNVTLFTGAPAAILSLVLLFGGCQSEKSIPTVPQWQTVEIPLSSDIVYANPYTDVVLTALFVNEEGDTLIRPGFWDGGQNWTVRFASPDDHSRWYWRTESTPVDPHLTREGLWQAVPTQTDNALLQHGLLKMSPGKRNAVHADGKPFLMVGDTPWALPFRAKKDQAASYAAYRQAQGFNTALLMVVQPDTGSTGPDARDTEGGFARAFTDLSRGHINALQPAYFQYLDSLIAHLIAHEIVPVYQPVFHGFGWKGEGVLGPHVVAEEYVRFCRYLLARYGSQPAMWLLTGDNGGRGPGVQEAGYMLEATDAYAQPTGLHYNPCDDFVADWAKNDPDKHCMHYNKVYQAEPWLDFQWAQTGHNGDHQLHKVERMYDNLPTKAAANGEPTYEGMGNGQLGLGWWQGEEAWLQLLSGGTMGVVYGAAGLWQWKINADEAGWADWAGQSKAWHEALRMEGATYVGLVSQILAGLDWTDIEKHPELTGGEQLLLAKPGRLYVSYLPEGGQMRIEALRAGLRLRWINPQNGQIGQETQTDGTHLLTAPSLAPWVLVISEGIE